MGSMEGSRRRQTYCWRRWRGPFLDFRSAQSVVKDWLRGQTSRQRGPVGGCKEGLPGFPSTHILLVTPLWNPHG